MPCRSVSLKELVSAAGDPFCRHHVDSRGDRRAWVRGRAAVVDGATTRAGAPRPAFDCLGPAEDLDQLRAARRGWTG